VNPLRKLCDDVRFSRTGGRIDYAGVITFRKKSLCGVDRVLLIWS